MFFGDQPQEEQPNTQEQEARSLYEIIGLEKQATTNQITKHFRRRAVKEHPDKGGDPVKYRQLSEAYEILKDPVKRDLYDKYGMEGVKAGGDPNGGGDFFNFFQGGQQNQGPRKCKPKLITITITLVEAFHGGSREETVIRVRTCEKCEGKGGANSKQCTGCKGARVKEKLVMIGPGMYTRTAAPCDDCHGQGVIFDQKDKCQNCKGERVIEVSKVFQVTIEPGVPHENDIIFTGEADEYPGTLAGDLYFRILIESHPQFRRKGADLYHTKKITLLQSLTGVTFELKLLDESTIICSTAPGQILSNHERKIVKHKGMPFFKEQMSKGHLVITFDIVYPGPGEINDKDYARLASILGQPLQHNVDKTANVRVLEHYEDPKAHHQEQAHDDQDEGQGQSIQCQNQ